MVEQVSAEYLVERPDLLRRLDHARDLPLTMIVAPAGAGKTVLLQQWAAATPGLAMAWIGIEPDDDDPMRFSRRLLAALSAVRTRIGGLMRLSALGAGGLGDPFLDHLATELASFPETVIVLDDLHHLSNRTLLADIGRLVAAIPPNVHLVIATRSDPPIAWSRLRLRNRMHELRQLDLAMTRDESAELLARITRRDIGPDAVDAIASRTEGWAAGLQLAGLTLKFQGESEEFVAELSGSDRLIAEYLTEEVLDALSDSTRTLLLRMSALDVMTAELVDHVLGRTDAQQLFEQLEHESMFLVAIDQRRTRVRFHHLFRDLLRYRLRAEDAAEERRLLVAAADFHLAHGELTPAVEYLLRSREWDRALDAIMSRGSDVFERGEMHTVIRWITAVPEHARADRLDVQLELGILVGMQGESIRAADAFRRVADDPRATNGERAIADAWISATAQWCTSPDETLRAAERLLARLELESIDTPDLMGLTTPELLRTLATGSGGRSHFLLGDLVEAEAWIEQGLATDGVAYPPYRVGLLGSLALLHAWSGRLADAELLAAEAIETAAAAALVMHPIIADAYLAQALVAHERGRPEAAARPLENGVIAAESNHRSQLSWIARYEAALAAGLEGRFEDALELTELVPHDADGAAGAGRIPASAPAPVPAPAPAVRDRLVAARMSALRRSGRAEQALHLYPADRRGLGAAPSIALEAVAASLALGQVDAAKALLADSTDRFRTEPPRGAVQRLLLRAWAAALEGSRHAALEFVDAALARAEPEGLVAPFLESDDVVLDLVADLAPVRGGLAGTVVALDGRRIPARANATLAEPLTDRELEILGHLPDHSTTAELAGMCFVSINTIKTHTAHIYRKLGVTGRSAAIAKARELGLLAPLSRADHLRA
ncbi:LuxR C-terminal-related transcriptional regulator [Agromyces aureus]|uniref:HTH luxR-type domain-containing protein n=1 Tax=Agromyces aureus TaxID=453304 RepID=A0A191WJL4_9MICO|nr:LuxR C-terminal-related transcriptional regulator [Agromyces aureus]ANJ28353.1 hypothetical protein ATC03_18265 [Agromyces aureus]